MADQTRAIKDRFPESEVILLKVPVEGLTLEQMKEDASSLDDSRLDAIVFASPIPALIMLVVRVRENHGVYVLHNDKRVAKEIKTPSGEVKVIHTVSPDGWEIV